MKIVLFTHPTFLSHQSMPRYANMLVEGMLERGHEVAVWKPRAVFYKLPFGPASKKWLSYLDQYIVFPLEVQFKLLNCSSETLFVFADQALGPWVPLVKKRKQVVHCHDFLALKSALGYIPENPTSKTGKLYQEYIRRGFSKGKNFISISKKTRSDLEELHLGKMGISEVCYNGLSRSFYPLSVTESRLKLGQELALLLSDGYIMHIGGNQYYKNRKGVLEIYESWRTLYKNEIPLLLIGEVPSAELKALYSNSKFKKDIYFITNLEDQFINIAYSGASCLLFPSLDEGFGWPIIEAMASGCPVITTNKAPMNEIGGSAAFYIEPQTIANTEKQIWANKGAAVLQTVLSSSSLERETIVENSIANAQKFTAKQALDGIEAVYKKIIK